MKTLQKGEVAEKKPLLEFTAKMKSHGRVTIPKWVRDELNLKDGCIVKLVAVRRVR